MYSLGLSATPKRKDGLSRVFEWYIGNIVYLQKEKNEDYVEVQLIECIFSDQEYSKEELNFRKEPLGPKMINNISYHIPRNLFINDIIKTEYETGRKILVLGDRREYLSNTQYIPENYHSAHALFSITLGSYEKREEIIQRLNSNHIPIVVYYKHPIHLMKGFAYLGYKKSDFPVSENLSQTIVSLPMHPYLNHNDIDLIIQTLRDKQ